MSLPSSHDINRISAAKVSPSPPSTPEERRRLAALAQTMPRRTSRAAYSPVVMVGLVRVFEFAILYLIGYFSFKLYVPESAHDAIPYHLATLGVSALAIIAFQTIRMYTTSAFRAPLPSGLRLASAWAIVLVGSLSINFFLKLDGQFSRVWIATWFIAGLTALIVERACLASLMKSFTRRGLLERRTVIVGGGDIGANVLQELARQGDTDLRIYGVFDDRTDERSPDVVAGFPKLGNVDDLVEFARTTPIDLIIFTLPITAEQRILQMLRKLWVLPVDIRLAAHSNRLRLRPRSYSYIGDMPVLDLLDKPIADWDVILKMAFDRIVGALALIALSPVFLVTAIAIKLDSRGPVFFKQKRYGFNNELIEVFKFRSMYVDQLDPTASKLVTRGDPRVTRVGRFIRKSSIDELPQLFNVVFRGDLSLVGPRPHAVHAKAADRQYDEVVDGYFARHRVRPGITGWAQINGWRGETDTSEKIQRRVEHDLYYIENWSIFFDFYILAVTPFSILKSENAF